MSLVQPHMAEEYDPSMLFSMSDRIGRHKRPPEMRAYSLRINKDRCPSVAGLRYLYHYAVQQNALCPHPIPLVLCLGDKKADHKYMNTRPHFFITKAEQTHIPMPEGISMADVTHIDLIGHDDQMSPMLLEELSKLLRHEEYEVEFIFSTRPPFFVMEESGYFDLFRDLSPEYFEVSTEKVFENPGAIQTVFLKTYNRYTN